MKKVTAMLFSMAVGLNAVSMAAKAKASEEQETDVQEHAALVYKIFCISESNDARECAAPGVVASIASGCGETNA